MERQSQVLKEKPNERTAQRLTEVFERYEDAGIEPPAVKRGPSRKLSLEQEFLMTLMKFFFLFFLFLITFIQSTIKNTYKHYDTYTTYNTIFRIQ